jgi:hypothetical protein
LGIEKYDGSTNPAEWLEVYELAIEAALKCKLVEGPLIPELQAIGN